MWREREEAGSSGVNLSSTRARVDLQPQKAFEHASAIGMGVVEQFGVKLHTKKRTLGVLHRLDGTRLICGSREEIRRETFDFIEMRMPNRDSGGQVLEDSLSIRPDLKETSLAFGAGVPFARFQASHQPDRSSEGQSHLLMTATNPEDWLLCFPDYGKDSGQRFRRVTFPGMTLTAEDDVRRTQ